jgi:hypothetical protein
MTVRIACIESVRQIRPVHHGERTDRSGFGSSNKEDKPLTRETIHALLFLGQDIGVQNLVKDTAAIGICQGSLDVRWDNMIHLVHYPLDILAHIVRKHGEDISQPPGQPIVAHCSPSISITV